MPMQEFNTLQDAQELTPHQKAVLDEVFYEIWSRMVAEIDPAIQTASKALQEANIMPSTLLRVIEAKLSICLQAVQARSKANDTE